MTTPPDMTARLDSISMALVPLRDNLFGLGDELYRLGHLLGRPDYPTGPVPSVDDPRLSIDEQQAASMAAGIGELTTVVRHLRLALNAQHAAHHPATGRR